MLMRYSLHQIYITRTRIYVYTCVIYPLTARRSVSITHSGIWRRWQYVEVSSEQQSKSLPGRQGKSYIILGIVNTQYVFRIVFYTIHLL